MSMSAEGQIGLAGLTYDDLLAVKNKVDQTFKFTLPGTDKELDIRDYRLQEACGMYMLVRKEEPRFEPSWNEWRYTLEHKPQFHFAHFIYLKDCSPDLARQLLETYPHLESK